LQQSLSTLCEAHSELVDRGFELVAVLLGAWFAIATLQASLHSSTAMMTFVSLWIKP
jgi:hypothetical protein